MLANHHLILTGPTHRTTFDGVWDVFNGVALLFEFLHHGVDASENVQVGGGAHIALWSEEKWSLESSITLSIAYAPQKWCKNQSKNTANKYDDMKKNTTTNIFQLHPHCRNAFFWNKQRTVQR